MAIRLANICRVTTATTGTGTLTLGSAVSGFLTPAQAGIADGDVVTYCIENGTTAREIGRGTYTSSGTTLSRDTVLNSTNSNAALNLSGSSQVFISPSEIDLRRRENRVVNSDFRRYTRTVAATADRVPIADGWYVLNQSNPVTPSALTDPENGSMTAIRISQSNASAQRTMLAQVMRSEDCRDLRGQVVCLAARIRASASQAIRFAILEWTGTADAPTREFVNTWTSGTYTTGNFFTSTTLTVVAVGAVTPAANTWRDFFISGTISSSLNNVYIAIWTEGTAAQNFTLDVTRVWFGDGAVPPPWARRDDDQVACNMRVRKGKFAVVSGQTLTGTNILDYIHMDTPMPQLVTAGITLSGISYFQASSASATVHDQNGFYVAAQGTSSGSYAQAIGDWIADGELGSP